jgi:hypothetical protein
MRTVELHSIDETVVQAVRVALVSALGPRIFKCEFGTAVLHRSAVKIVYRRMSQDTALANVKFNGYKFMCTIEGLSHGMTRITWIEIMEDLEKGISHDSGSPYHQAKYWDGPESTWVEWGIWELLELSEIARVTQLLSKLMPENDVLLAIGHMCEIPIIRPLINGEGASAEYIFDDPYVESVKIRRNIGLCGLLSPHQALIKMKEGKTWYVDL